MSIIFGLIADNSSGKQRLHFTKGEDGGLYLSLTGVYDEKDIQIDFEELNSDDIGDLIHLLKRFKQ